MPAERDIEEALNFVDVGAHPSHCHHFHVLATAVRSLRKELEGVRVALKTALDAGVVHMTSAERAESDLARMREALELYALHCDKDEPFKHKGLLHSNQPFSECFGCRAKAALTPSVNQEKKA